MTAGPDETFVLTKNDYGESTKNILKSLFSDSEFTDVSLASSDHKQLRGHKAILGAASSFGSAGSTDLRVRIGGIDDAPRGRVSGEAHRAILRQRRRFFARDGDMCSETMPVHVQVRCISFFG